ncbi:MAG TPA: hypothetical protein VKA89_00340, partial [Solirubrobacterales bacterium]|nr:hypothetical protein [Solirubrobacterales bacterium]
MSEATATRASWRRLVPAAVLALAAAIVAALLLPAGGDAARANGKVVNVMTRNVYLGADLTPAINASGPNEFSHANGKILRDVDTNNFPVRARGLAKEIRGKSPDLVGLQEVALWRENPNASLAPAVGTGPKTATTVHQGGDFLALLMARLNQGKKRYRVVKVQNEFDFEAPADYNNTPGDGDPAVAPVMPDAEMNGRLTMRDVILAKVKAGVRTSNAKGRHFKT